MSSTVMSKDFTGTRAFVEACLDESRHDTFRKIRDRLDPAFGEWADAQYRFLERSPVWPAVLEATLDAGPLPAGMLCEFGVCTGNSTNLIAKKLAPREVYGFDSFEGLPNDWIVGHIRVPKGFLAIDPEKVRFESNVRLVKGYFCDSLPAFIEQHPDPISLMHVDCDTYHSTVDVFKYTAPSFQVGTVIVFDEILGDMGTENELKALWELLERRHFGFEWLARGGHCWTAETQARFQAVKKGDLFWGLKFAIANLGSVAGLLRNEKKLENALPAAALRITALP